MGRHYRRTGRNLKTAAPPQSVCAGEGRFSREVDEWGRRSIIARTVGRALLSPEGPRVCLCARRENKRGSGKGIPQITENWCLLGTDKRVLVGSFAARNESVRAPSCAVGKGGGGGGVPRGIEVLRGVGQGAEGHVLCWVSFCRSSENCITDVSRGFS